ncbi:hypothetical protein JZ751_010631 [Albula glossodonta]|uniref:Homeobox-containing protein 1-like n=1 Tax=Albula glossodonta TaxID=121402 RepID=A0A8T2MWI7_9TELE|nr:hypothetical protein JZ751_010631 [Albula glossodonta]
MRQWCVPAIAPSSEPLLTGIQSPRLSGAAIDARMEYCDAEPRYTIEQIDLLQRLRLSGMSKPQIVHALESLERLDPAPGSAPSATPGPGPTPTNAQSSSLSSSSSLTSATTQTPSLDASPSPSNSYEASPPPLYSGGGGQRSFCYDLVEEDWDVEEKVEEYMRRDSNMVKEEIKVFLNNRRISQAIVGQVTGISQSYISQWLLQQGLEMSDSKRRAFYRWYLLERSSPGATLSFRPLVKEEPDWRASVSPGGGGAAVGSMGGAGVTPVGGALRLRRGSRFTWRKECLSIMEGFFMENQYPDEAKREEIANACNCVIQKPAVLLGVSVSLFPATESVLLGVSVSLFLATEAVLLGVSVSLFTFAAPGCKLSEFERVTALKVYNWFANRRKDMKRRANIEAAILESHGIEVQSPSCHSNGEEVEPNELVEQVGGDLRQTTLYQEEVSTRKDPEQDAASLATGLMTLPSPTSHLANQKADELKREAADEEEKTVGQTVASGISLIRLFLSGARPRYCAQNTWSCDTGTTSPSSLYRVPPSALNSTAKVLPHSYCFTATASQLLPHSYCLTATASQLLPHSYCFKQSCTLTPFL